MKVPTGHNTINPVRLDDMYKAVQGFGTDEDAFHAAVARLTPEEKATIQSDSMRGTWLSLIEGDFFGHIVQLYMAADDEVKLDVTRL